MKPEDVIGWLEFMKEKEHDKADSIVSCDTEIALGMAIKTLKEREGLTLALEQANATINYLNEEKEKAIKEIKELKAFNLKCDGQPEWLRKGIDVGLNTALNVLKDKEDKQK